MKQQCNLKEKLNLFFATALLLLRQQFEKDSQHNTREKQIQPTNLTSDLLYTCVLPLGKRKLNDY